MDSGKSPRISTPGRPGPRKLPLYSPSERSPFRFETLSLSLNQHFIWNVSVSMMTLSRFLPQISSSKMVSFPVSKFMIPWSLTWFRINRNNLFDFFFVKPKGLVKSVPINLNKISFLPQSFQLEQAAAGPAWQVVSWLYNWIIGLALPFYSFFCCRWSSNHIKCSAVVDIESSVSVNIPIGGGSGTIRCFSQPQTPSEERRSILPGPGDKLRHGKQLK